MCALWLYNIMYTERNERDKERERWRKESEGEERGREGKREREKRNSERASRGVRSTEILRGHTGVLTS